MRDSGRDAPNSAPASLRVWLPALTFALLCALAALALPMITALYRVPLLYNEGWNAYHAVRALEGLNIYSRDNPLITLNYPPLFYYLSGTLGALIGDQIMAARAIASVSLFVVTGCIVAIVHHLRGAWPPALFAGAVFLALMAALHTDYIGTAEPQWLAHALMMLGLTAFITRRETRAWLITASLLMLLGGFVKHNLIALPLAVTLYLLVFERRHILIWILAGALFSAIGLGLCLALYGPDFIASLNSARDYRLPEMVRKSIVWLSPLAVPLLFWLLYLLRWREQPRLLLFVHLFAVLALAVTLLVAGSVGVHYNGMFEFVIALCLLLPFTLEAIDLRRQHQPLPPMLVRLCLAVLLLSPTLPPIANQLGALRAAVRGDQLAQRVAATEADIAFLRAVEGPAVCENLALCLWADKDFVLDPYSTRQAVIRGRLDETPLLQRLAAGEISVVHLQHQGMALIDERFSPEFLASVEEHFLLQRRSSNGVFYLHRRLAPMGDDAQHLAADG